MATPREALQKLRTDPQHFLSQYWLQCTRQMNLNGPATFYIGARGSGELDWLGREKPARLLRPGTNNPNRMHNSKNFIIVPQSGRLGILGDSESVSVWHVDVTPSLNIVGNMTDIPFLPVSKTAGPDIMVTTSLNGCTFICKTVGNDVWMAHVQPTNRLSAVDLANKVQNEGGFMGTQGGITSFGSNHLGVGAQGYSNTTNHVTIIGVRKGNSWHVVAQKQNAPNVPTRIDEAVEFFVG